MKSNLFWRFVLVVIGALAGVLVTEFLTKFVNLPLPDWSFVGSAVLGVGIQFFAWCPGSKRTITSSRE